MAAGSNGKTTVCLSFWAVITLSSAQVFLVLSQALAVIGGSDFCHYGCAGSLTIHELPSVFLHSLLALCLSSDDAQIFCPFFKIRVFFFFNFSHQVLRVLCGFLDDSFPDTFCKYFLPVWGLSLSPPSFFTSGCFVYFYTSC